MTRCNYIVRKLKTMEPVPGHCYEQKGQAKQARKALNATHDGKEELKYIVSPGPDHPKHAQA